MQFGHLFASSQHPPWSDHYIDYHRLKKLLHVLYDRDVTHADDGRLFVSAADEGNASYYGSSDAVGHDGILNQSRGDGPVSIDPISDAAANAQVTSEPMKSSDFQRELNQEIQKAVLFILKSMGELASELSTLMAYQKTLAGNIQPLLHSRTESTSEQTLIDNRCTEVYDLRMEFLVRIGNKLLLLLQFVDLNVEAVTKIVKKHDKCFARWEASSCNNTHGRMRSLSVSSSGGSPRYERLRRLYLPRFARFSTDPNIRCLFLLAADAGDCYCGTSGSYANNGQRSKESNGSFGGWDVMQWNLEKSLRELFHWTEGLKQLVAKERGQLKGSGEAEVLETEMLLNRSKSMSERHKQDISKTHKPRSGSISNFIGSMSNLVSRDDSSKILKTTFFEPVLYRIQLSRRHLGQTTDRYSRMVYAHEMLHIIDDKRIIQDEDEKYLMQMQVMRGKDLDGEKWMEEEKPMVSGLSKFLNLMSSCLYMCNYNIVAPTSGLYAKLLGFDPANAGIIIGMTPLAVIGSSVVYSWWSSYSYKKALLFASFCCIVGNTVYALALPCDSLAMVLLGRMCIGLSFTEPLQSNNQSFVYAPTFSPSRIGFGSARVINRRYIADYYSIETRTAGMASFVSASAFGMAVGPALAASFSLIAPHGKITDHPSIKSSWTIETAPGWFMAVLWMIYLILNALYFEEPDRAKPIVESELPKVKLDNANEQPDLQRTSQSAKCWSGCNIPVLLSLLVLVLLKSVLEGLTSSAPTVSSFYFGWGSHASGIYLALMASLVLPVNFFVASVSRRYDDREMILVLLAAMLVGVVGLLVYSENGTSYSETRFIWASIIIFCSSNAIEAPTMGLLSKTIPKSMASGILNAGLLATEAGTIGRVVGDFYFSAAAFKGMEYVVNMTFEPMGLLIVLSILFTLFNYSKLQPRYEDEEDEDDD